MKTKIIIIIAAFIALTSYSQEDFSINVHTIDVNNMKFSNEFINISYENSGIDPLPKINENVFLHSKIGLGYSGSQIGSSKSSVFYIPIQVGLGYKYKVDSFSIYSSLTAGFQVGYAEIEIGSENSSDFSFDFISSLNFGGIYFFSKESKYGLIAEYSYALKGVDKISIGLALKM